jgi:hypothetical protein
VRGGRGWCDEAGYQAWRARHTGDLEAAAPPSPRSHSPFLHESDWVHRVRLGLGALSQTGSKRTLQAPPLEAKHVEARLLHLRLALRPAKRGGRAWPGRRGEGRVTDLKWGLRGAAGVDAALLQGDAGTPLW